MTSRLSVPVALAVVAFGCGGDSTEPLVPTTLQLDLQSIVLDLDESVTINAVVLDQHGNAFATPPEGFAIQWVVSDETVAQVVGGVVTGVGEGTASITATAGTLPPVTIPVEVESKELFGEIVFDYSGELSGTWELSSTFRLLPSGPDSPEFVVTFHDADFGSHDILAERALGGGRFDLVWFWVEGEVTATGTHAADDGFIVFGFSPAQQTADAAFDISDGSVTFAAVSSSRMSGTFELAFEGAENTELIVEAGTFDAPLIPVADILGDASDAAASPASATSREALRKTLLRMRDGVR